MANNAVLPAAASPPVSAMPKPIVIGSAARTAVPARMLAASVATAVERRRSFWLSWVIVASLISGRAPLTDRANAALIRPSKIENNRGEPAMPRLPPRAGNRLADMLLSGWH
jgi:hypothetical protein